MSRSTPASRVRRRGASPGRADRAAEDGVEPSPTSRRGRRRGRSRPRRDHEPDPEGRKSTRRCATSMSPPTATSARAPKRGAPRSRRARRDHSPAVPPFQPNQSTRARKTPSATSPSPISSGCCEPRSRPRRAALLDGRGRRRRSAASSGRGLRAVARIRLPGRPTLSAERADPRVSIRRRHSSCYTERRASGARGRQLQRDDRGISRASRALERGSRRSPRRRRPARRARSAPAGAAPEVDEVRPRQSSTRCRRPRCGARAHEARARARAPPRRRRGSASRPSRTSPRETLVEGEQLGDERPDAARRPEPLRSRRRSSAWWVTSSPIIVTSSPLREDALRRPRGRPRC